MQPEFAIVHNLHKAINTIPELKLKPDLLPLDMNTQQLAADLLALYERKATKGYGSFDLDAITYPFSSCLKAFHTSGGSENFITFTHGAMRILESKIKIENMAVGGFVLFVSSMDEGKRFLFMTLLRNTRGCVITENLEISQTEHLQIDKLHTGCHIDMDAWQRASKDPYITFIKGRSSHTTPAYFLNAIGCSEFTDSLTQTKEFIKAINDFSETQGLTPEQRRELRQKVHTYCVDKTNVDLEALCVIVYEDNPESLLQHLNTGNYKVSQGFTPHKQTLKVLREVSTHGEGIHLRFPLSMLNSRVILKEDGTEKMLLIKNPPEKIIKDIREASQ